MPKIIPQTMGIAIVLVIYLPIIIYIIILVNSFLKSQPYGYPNYKFSDQVAVPTQEQKKVEIPEDILNQVKERGEVIKITNKGFEPKEIRVLQGEAVSFINYDSKLHQILNYTFSTEEMEPGNIWTFPCNEKGVFEYYLKDSPGKTGRIIVE